MGVVLKQTVHNTLITYAGFGIGAINTLFLYTHFMSSEYYGLVQVILSVSAVMMPIMAFGVPNTLVKFFSGFKPGLEREGFLILMIMLPLLFIVPIALITVLANEAIGSLLSRENPIVRDYLWHIFFIGLAMAYFEIFYSWSKVYLKSIVGNFMKEIFCRLFQTLLLVLLWLNKIDVQTFLNGLVLSYVLRMVLMKVYAYTLHKPHFKFTWPHNLTEIIKYSLLIILGGSIAMVLIEVDKVMLNNYLKIENVAYYGVAGFMAATIAVPSRAMHQITYPLTAQYLNNGNFKALKDLYQRSSLTLFTIAGILFLLLLLNLRDIYTLIPKEYSGGFMIVFWIGMVKVYDAILGNNNSILYNSNYYQSILWLGVILALLAIGLNMWLIPKYGLDGAAIASFMAFFIYNTLKVVYVKLKFKMVPFTKQTLILFLLLVGIGVLFNFLPFGFTPIINIILKSGLIILCYVGSIYLLKISEDMNRFIKGLFSK